MTEALRPVKHACLVCWACGILKAPHSQIMFVSCTAYLERLARHGGAICVLCTIARGDETLGALRLLAYTAVPADGPDGNTNGKPTDHAVWSGLPFEILTRFAQLIRQGSKGSPGPKPCL